MLNSFFFNPRKNSSTFGRLKRLSPQKTTAQKTTRQKIAAIAAGSLLLPLLSHLSAAAIPASETLIAQGYPLLSPGSTGDSVSRLQATLKLLGFYQGPVDGSYTPATADAVAQFQSAAGISADGVAGPSTWASLLPEPSDVARIPASEIPAQPEPEAETLAAQPEGTPELPILRPGIEGPAVEAATARANRAGLLRRRNRR